MKKINTLLLLFLISTITMFAQGNESTRQILNDAKYVFKGTVLSSTPFKGENANDFFVSHIITIETIYKGEGLKIGKVNLISKSPEGWTEMEDGTIIYDVTTSHYASPEHADKDRKFEIDKGVSAVFVCNKMTSTLPKTSLKTINNDFVLEPICDKFNCFFYYGTKATIKNDETLRSIYIKGFNQHFNISGKVNKKTGQTIWNDKPNVWKQLDVYLNEIGLVSQEKIAKKKDVTFLEKEKLNKLLTYKERVKNSKENFDLLNKGVQEKANNKKAGDITFEITNDTIIDGNPRYYEFDVMVSSSGIFLDQAQLDIQYNTAQFGTSIVTNQTVVATLGTNFDATDYFPYLLEPASNWLRIIVLPGSSPYNRPLINSVQQELVHVKIEIQNCTGFAGLQFINQSTADDFVYSTPTSTSPSNQNAQNLISNVTYTQPSNSPECTLPQITNVFPNSISSGTGSILTIQGSGFGNPRGSGQIQMLNDRKDKFGNRTLIEAFDYIDYQSWTDTKIEFIVPSYVDTLPFRGFAPGSSIIQVLRNDGLIASSTSAPTPNVSIVYAHSSIAIARNFPEFRKIPYRVGDITPTDLDTGMVFFLNTTFANDTNKVKAVQQALKDWSCATLINWKVKGTTVAKKIVDGQSTIYFDDTFYGNPLARTHQRDASTCVNENGQTIVYFKDIDIGYTASFDSVSSEGNGWFVNTDLLQDVPADSFDFFHVVSHEFGHAHGLDHVTDNTDLMYFGSRAGFTNGINRYDVFRSTNAILGGDSVVRGSSLLSSCSGIEDMIPIASGDCAPIIGLDELFNKDIRLLVYPNPTNDLVTLSFKLERNANITISLYDYVGKQIKTIHKGKQNIGHQKVEMNVDNVASGFYFLKVQINNRIETVKLIVR